MRGLVRIHVVVVGGGGIVVAGVVVGVYVARVV